MSLQTAFNIAQILISIVMVIVLTLQAKGSGFGSALGGQTTSVFRTRRGVEKTLYQFTIGTAVVFVVLAIVSTVVG